MGQGNNRDAPIGKNLSHSLFVGFTAVAAAAGAMEAESASVAIDKIDESIAKYSSLLASRANSGT